METPAKQPSLVGDPQVVSLGRPEEPSNVVYGEWWVERFVRWLRSL